MVLLVPKPKGIVFDFYGTLVHHPPDRDPEVWKLFREDSMTRSMSAPFTRTDTNKDEFRRLSTKLSEEISAVTLADGCIEVLKKLYWKNFPTGLLSNLAPPYKRPFNHFELYRWFSVCAWSCDTGLLKPDPAAFRLIASYLRLEPEEILMVGDSLRSDIEGARNAGMQAVRITPMGGKAMEGDITKLSEVLDMI